MGKEKEVKEKCHYGLYIVSGLVGLVKFLCFSEKQRYVYSNKNKINRVKK